MFSPHGFGVGDADDESLPSLSGQGSSTLVHDGSRHKYRHFVVLLFEELLDGVQSGLGVSRVEDCLHQEKINTAIQQSSGLGSVGFNKLVKG